MTPFFLVFLTAYIEEDQDPESYDISLLPPEILSAIEADSYWCLSKLLDGIQDNFTHAQPGIQRQIVKLRELICRIDAPLAAHLQSEHVEFIQFSFRWMNCLLMREVTLQHTIRMWDTYLVSIYSPIAIAGQTLGEGNEHAVMVYNLLTGTLSEMHPLRPAL